MSFMDTCDEISFSRGYASGLIEGAKQERKKILDKLDKIIEIREDEMARKGGLEDNIVTASGYFASNGALNWVRKIAIKQVREES